MNQFQIQQIECLIVLAEELHFGRTASRLGYSQSRVSQLIADLERRMEVRLVDRTSRRVALTRFGAQFVDEVRPAYRRLDTVFHQARERARRGALRELRIGFHGNVYEEISEAFRRLKVHSGVSTAVSEIPLGSPFSGVMDGQVDAAVVELPVHEGQLEVGYRFPPQDRLVAVSTSHPLADGDKVDAEELANLDLLHPLGDAPAYWMTARTPRATPAGQAIRSTVGISTVQEGLAFVAGGDHAMLVCRPIARRTVRGDVRYLEIVGLDESSQLALIWRRDRVTSQLTTLAELLGEEFSRTESGKARFTSGAKSVDAPLPKEPGR